jgi:hypothetical protein
MNAPFKAIVNSGTVFLIPKCFICQGDKNYITLPLELTSGITLLYEG